MKGKNNEYPTRWTCPKVVSALCLKGKNNII